MDFEKWFIFYYIERKKSIAADNTERKPITCRDESPEAVSVLRKIEIHPQRIPAAIVEITYMANIVSCFYEYEYYFSYQIYKNKLFDHTNKINYHNDKSIFKN